MVKGGEFIIPNGKLPDIFTVNDFTEEQLMIQETVREFVAKEINTDDSIKKIESKDWAFSRELLKKMADIGLLGTEVPEKYGGQGLDKVVGAIIAEEIAKQGSFACTFLAHTGIGTLPIRFFGTEEQKARYLPKLISGEWVAAYCLTEGMAGSDANGIKTTAKLLPRGDVFSLNGEKMFVTNGGFADLFIIFAQLENYGLTAFIVEKNNTLGLLVGQEEHKMGIQGSSTATIVLSDALVPAGNLLGEPGKGFKIALNILNLGRFKLGAACLGAGRRAFQQALHYAKERTQFGQPIINFGAMRQKLAWMAAKIYAMESLVYRTAGHLEEAIGKIDTNDPKAVLKAIEEFVIECSMVKVFCSEALDFIVDENVQIHGGYGFCEGNPERAYRDSRINRIFEGTNEINRLLIIAMLLKKAVATDGLSLMPVIKQVGSEAMSVAVSTEPEDLLERLIVYLNNAKRAVLLVAGFVYEKYLLKLEAHQIVLMALSDCLISIYVMESSLAALVKNQTDLNLSLVKQIFHEALLDVEKLTKEIVTMCAEGDDQQIKQAMIKRILKFNLVNLEEISDKIITDS